MRKLLAYLSAILLAASCTTELERGRTVVDASLEGAPVTITFSVPDVQVLPATRSLETGDGNITDDVMSIRNLMNMNYDIKR